MVLETVDNPNVSLDNLTVPPETPRKLNAVEELVSESDWKTISEALNYYKDSNLWGFLDGAVAVKLALPSRYEELSDAEDWNRVSSLVARRMDTSQPGGTAGVEEMAKLFSMVKLLFPDRVSQLTSAPRYSRLIYFFSGYTSIDRTDYPYWLKIIYSEEPDIDSKLKVNQANWEMQKENLEKLRRARNKRNFVEKASMSRVIFGELYDLKISDDEWKKIELQFQNSTPVELANYFKLLTGIAILKAKKVEVTKNGLELSMGDERTVINSEPNVQPEERSF